MDLPFLGPDFNRFLLGFSIVLKIGAFFAVIALSIWIISRQPSWVQDHVTGSLFFGLIGWLIATLVFAIYPQSATVSIFGPEHIGGAVAGSLIGNIGIVYSRYRDRKKRQR